MKNKQIYMCYVKHFKELAKPNPTTKIKKYIHSTYFVPCSVPAIMKGGKEL